MTRHDHPGAKDLLRLAASLGLAVGFFEAAFRVVQRMTGRRTFLSRDVLWMAPLADLALFLLVALIAIAIARAIRRPLDLRTAFTILAFIAILGPILAFPRLHPVAGLVLALGIAAVAGRGLARVPRPRRRAERALVPLLTLLGIAFASVRGGEWLRERGALAGLPPAVASGSPSVLLLILDTVRAKSLGLYGYDLPTTPRLEALEGAVVFDRAWATAPWTLPSHVGFFTGLYPYETEADWLAPLGPEPLTLAEYLASRGYVTGGFVGNLIYATWETGLQRGFARYEDYPVSAAMVANSAWIPRRITRRVTGWLGRDRFLVHKTAEDINQDVLGWVDRHSERPFFAFVNYMDAHAPYVPPDSLYDRFGPRRTWRARGDLMFKDDWTEAELEAERAAYDATIAYLDEQVARLLAGLAERGRLDHTLVIVASDHGEQLGEHGLVDHGNSLYRPLLHVPLVVRPPAGGGPQRRIASPVSLRDVPATVADVLGDPGGPFPGVSLRGLWTDGAPGDSAGGAGDVTRGGDDAASVVLAEVSRGIRMEEGQPAAVGDMRSLVFEAHHYILNGDGREELYALADSSETTDLAGEPVADPLLERARATLDTLTASPRTP